MSDPGHIGSLRLLLLHIYLGICIIYYHMFFLHGEYSALRCLGHEEIQNSSWHVYPKEKGAMHQKRPRGEAGSQVATLQPAFVFGPGHKTKHVRK